jgi:chorismate dehydratase
MPESSQPQPSLLGDDRVVGDDSRAGLGSSNGQLRVGGIDYLNALPLLYGLEDDGGAPPVRLSFHSPSRLASLLRSEDLDVALLPVVAFLDDDDYAIIPDVGISSYGGVWSIRLFHRRPLPEVRSLALDKSSRTSALLAQLLLREVWSARADEVTLDPAQIVVGLLGRDPAFSFDAALLIGDAALTFREVPGWSVVDLGTQWTRWTGLPFVYAFWVLRGFGPGVSVPLGLAARFLAARDRGWAHIDAIVATAKLPEGISPAEGRRYLSHLIQYDLGPDKLEALDHFFRRLEGAGLIEAKARSLRFLDPAECVERRNR